MRRIIKFCRYLNNNYNNSKETIISENARILVITNKLLTILISLYFAYAILLRSEMQLIIIIGCFFIINLLMTLLFLKDNFLNKSNTQFFSFLFLIIVLFFSALISGYYSQEPVLYFPLFMIVLNIIFTFKFSNILFITSITELIYLFYIFNYHYESHLYFNIKQSLAAYVLSIIVIIIIYSLRFSNYESQKQLQNLVKIDQLTGLSNKTSTKFLVQEYLNFKKDHSFHALFILDIDNFKELNDTLGHFVGDSFLQEIAKILKNTFRSDDIVGRFGGDEFVILMKNVKDVNVIEQKAVQVQERFKLLIKNYNNVNCTCSIGIAVDSVELKSYFSLFKVADIALYNCKYSGKDRYKIITCDANMKKIMLVVDDDETAKVIIKESFKDKFEIFEATNGLEAMKILNELSNYISIIILDIIMPKMDGNQFLDKISTESSYNKIPIIVTTSSDFDQKQNKHNNLIDVCYKPYNMELLKEKVYKATSKTKNIE